MSLNLLEGFRGTRRTAMKTAGAGVAAALLEACGAALTPEQIHTKASLTYFLKTGVPDSNINPKRLTFEEFLKTDNSMFEVDPTPRTGKVRKGQKSVTKRFPLPHGDEIPTLATATKRQGERIAFVAFVTIKKIPDLQHPTQPIADFLYGDPNPRSLWGIWKETIIDTSGKATEEWRCNRVEYTVQRETSRIIDLT